MGRSITSCLLLTALLAAMLACPDGARASSDAAIWAEVSANLAAIGVLKETILSKLKDIMKQDINTVPIWLAYDEFIISTNKTITDEYVRDHQALSGDLSLSVYVPADTIATYVMLSGTLTFGNLSSTAFQAAAPGYRDASLGVTDYAQSYKDRAAAVKSYSQTALNANVLAAAAISGNPQDIGMVSKLRNATASADGYRSLLQANNQILDMANQWLEKLRVDNERLVDATARLALEERQDKIDRQSAFDQAVKTWLSQNGGAGF
ncbi:MAG: hypothetical protein LBR38_02060 [Synergistaceae bacterium]|jgi:hypothetical protein|nr:hypothetical protein [Synergistaceae bacterium]